MLYQAYIESECDEVETRSIILDWDVGDERIQIEGAVSVSEAVSVSDMIKSRH